MTKVKRPRGDGGREIARLKRRLVIARRYLRAAGGGYWAAVKMIWRDEESRTRSARAGRGRAS